MMRKFKNKLKFKSLTMRIWTTFTVIILIIIFCISLLYLFAFRKINESARIQDLKGVHGFLLNGNNFSAADANRFDEFKNLKGSNNFILNVNDSKTQIEDLNKRDHVPPQGKDMTGPRPQDFINDNEVKMWMAGFVQNSNMYEKEFNQTYKNVRFLFIISSVNNSKSGKSYLITYMPNREDNNLLYMFIIVGVVFIAIGFVASKIVAQFIAKPLKELEAFTEKIARKDWKDPIIIRNEDEIGSLAASMNKMQKELKKADEEEKTFLQSISHDLKTPVMVIMSHADAIIDGVYIDSVENTAEIIRDEAIGLEKKIKQILYLNTLDYVLENNSEDTEINFKELLLHITSRFEVVNSKIEWNLDLQDIMVNGNLDKDKVAIENILENGLRYAKEEISISLDRQENFAVLEIYNDGPNIDSKHIDHIFDNLYKDKTGNFGLGLAITKKIIDFYGGEIKAVNRENGVSFIIKYPVLKEDSQQ
ncbi:HAMP domain-containing histidine kinase [Clostridium sp. YIM B02515]|uniref:histidine kinase n=2 Tax=Clostridium rhizosphaerae TaxID=2803861 RepID=A0ABS1TC89_9CLOT|nr:HAMP domain-containing sensor histidine kinase [Clostridium rhizosphaerae]MBL4935929.1 HAMP domain-containing histidine kinase [Clostridium rhizosphaerae]